MAVAHDGGERIIEFVGDAGDHLPQGGELVGLKEAGRKVAIVGVVAVAFHPSGGAAGIADDGTCDSFKDTAGFGHFELFAGGAVSGLPEEPGRAEREMGVGEAKHNGSGNGGEIAQSSPFAIVEIEQMSQPLACQPNATVAVVDDIGVLGDVQNHFEFGLKRYGGDTRTFRAGRPHFCVPRICWPARQP